MAFVGDRGRIVVLGLFLAAIVLFGVGLLWFNRVDTLVNEDLYEYGLRFDLGWYEPYASLAFQFLTSIEVAMLLVVGAVVTRVLIWRGDESSLAWWSFVGFVFGAVALGVYGIYVFYRVDWLVNNTLYEYGLQFSYEWADVYWSYARFLLVVVGAAVALLLVLGIVSLFGGRMNEEKRRKLEERNRLLLGLMKKPKAKFV